MAAAALCVYVAFLLIAFAARAAIHYRRTGDHGVRLRPARGLESIVYLLLLGGIVLGGIAAGVELLEIMRPARGATWWRGAGLVLSVIGMVIVVVSQYQMGDAWRVGVDARERTALVTRGLFSVVRNPLFTGVIVGTAGLALAVPNALSALALLSVLVGLELQVRAVEEPYLIRVHGEPYRSYARTVGRFVPGIGRLRVAPSRSYE